MQNAHSLTLPSISEDDEQDNEQGDEDEEDEEEGDPEDDDEDDNPDDEDDHDPHSGSSAARSVPEDTNKREDDCWHEPDDAVSEKGDEEDDAETVSLISNSHSPVEMQRKRRRSLGGKAENSKSNNHSRNVRCARPRTDIPESRIARGMTRHLPTRLLENARSGTQSPLFERRAPFNVAAKRRATFSRSRPQSSSTGSAITGESEESHPQLNRMDAQLQTIASEVDRVSRDLKLTVNLLKQICQSGVLGTIAAAHSSSTNNTEASNGGTGKPKPGILKNNQLDRLCGGTSNSSQSLVEFSENSNSKLNQVKSLSMRKACSQSTLNLQFNRAASAVVSSVSTNSAGNSPNSTSVANSHFSQQSEAVRSRVTTSGTVEETDSCAIDIESNKNIVGASSGTHLLPQTGNTFKRNLSTEL